ncbi:MAG: hypothetical protein B7C24_00435 [Bacteroidetes bacterium 4572_77]|nr:MAG: hypothetical protein B7C24_00435 [Bacteroidetes bacterium 4572_77]
MKKLILLIVVGLGFLSTTNAQKIKVESGDLSFLEDLADISVVFEYPMDMKYGKMTYETYMDKKAADREKKKEGSGEEWKEKFLGDQVRYNEKFIYALGKYTGDFFIAEDDPDYKYTMIVKTTFTEPGFQMGFRSKNSAIDLEITFIETNAPDKVLATVKLSKAPGAAHPDQGERVADAYFTAGQTFGKYLKKKCL